MPARIPMPAMTDSCSFEGESKRVLGGDSNLDTYEGSYVNDDFDDVFGSASSSPSTEHGNGLSTRLKQERGNEEPSDIPRLKDKHETEGYRDGVTKGKAESVQAGFDEGYGLGAVLGLRVGKVLGLLEGLLGAVNTPVRVGGAENTKAEQLWAAERDRLNHLFHDAKEELKAEEVFGKTWWGEDGIWKFDVPGEEAGAEEVVFQDVAAAHPLIRKWEGIADKEIEKWGLDVEVLGAENEHVETKELWEKKDELPTKTASGSAKELSW